MSLALLVVIASVARSEHGGDGRGNHPNVLRIHAQDVPPVLTVNPILAACVPGETPIAVASRYRHPGVCPRAVHASHVHHVAPPGCSTTFLHHVPLPRSRGAARYFAGGQTGRPGV